MNTHVDSLLACVNESNANHGFIPWLSRKIPTMVAFASNLV